MTFGKTCHKRETYPQVVFNVGFFFIFLYWKTTPYLRGCPSGQTCIRTLAIFMRTITNYILVETAL